MGAWIEKFKIGVASKVYLVAPYVGAWIENPLPLAQNHLMPSHPMWVRGLKIVLVSI